MDLSRLQTEAINARTAQIDSLSALEICRLINEEDASVARAVETCIPVIADAITAVAPRVQKGGRVLYVGAGTSGRLGVLDASEIPPTFSAPPDQFIAIVAGGDVAIRSAVEGAEDDIASALKDLDRLRPPLNPQLDTVIGIAASGRTPYVIRFLSLARSRGCLTVGISCVYPSELQSVADFVAAPVTGPEVLTGSTRMKAGTATKMVLNMISTGLMIKIGKTYGNLMVDIKASNSKLKQRARNIMRTVLPHAKAIPDQDLDDVINKCGGSVKLAILRLKSGEGREKCQSLLEQAQGNLATALKICENDCEDPVTPMESYPGLQHSFQEYRSWLDFEKRLTLKPQATAYVDTYEHAGDLAICIDAGGSVCSVAISDFRGATGTARAPPCNYTSVGLETALEIISEATQTALNRLTASFPKHPQYRFITNGRDSKVSVIRPRFRIVNVGMAGIDRPGAIEKLTPALAKMFNVPTSALTVTNDVEFLTFIIRHKHPSITEAVILVAGTGSVAMSYFLNSSTGKVVRKRRAGGWGSLLGDDGSGFEIGKRAIRCTLLALENNAHKLGKMQLKILKHFWIGNPLEIGSDLLDRIFKAAKEDEDFQKVVAEAARIVIESIDVDPMAAKIVDDAVAGLVRIVRSVMPGPGSPKPALVLSGGLMRSEVYRAKVLQMIFDAKMSFQAVEFVAEPALAAVAVLR